MCWYDSTDLYWNWIDWFEFGLKCVGGVVGVV